MPNKPYLTMSPEAEDERLLKGLSKKASIIDNLLSVKEVKLLWEICSIPDYSKNFDDSHSELLEQIYLFLIDKGEIPENWVNKKLDDLNNIKGELDLLGTRLANVRTWNYISTHKSWINSKSGISERARYIENRLSDALHEGLIERFVDYKMAKFSKSLDIDNELVAAIDKNNSVLVEGHHVGRLEGFSFVNEVSNNQQDKKEVLKIVRRTLYKEIKIRVANFQKCKDSEISFDKMMNIYWKNNIIAKLIKGSTITNPKIFLSNFILLDDIDKSNIKKRLSKFVKKSIASFMSPITSLDSKDKRTINGVIYQLNESLGAIKLYKEKKVISNLNSNDIKLLLDAGVKIGELFIWVPKLFEKRNREYLWSLRQIFYESKNRSTYPSIESIINKKNVPKEILYSNEFILIGENYYNVQLIEKIAKEIKEILKHKKIFFSTKKNSSYFRKKYKVSYSHLKDILHILNFERDKINPVKYIRKDNNLKKKSYIKVNNNNSPFAVLEKLTIN